MPLSLSVSLSMAHEEGILETHHQISIVAVLDLVSRRCCPPLLPLRWPVIALTAARQTCDLNRHQISTDNEDILDFEFHL